MHNHLKKQLDLIYQDKKLLDNYSFTLFYFIKSLYDICLMNGTENIFFLSREGKFLKQLYEIYADTRNDGNSAKTHYLYVSRKAVSLSCMNCLEEEPFLPFRGYNDLSVVQFLKGLSLTDDEIVGISNSMAFNCTSVIKNFFDSEVFKELIENNHFKVVYEKKRAASKTALLTYLQNSGFIDAHNPVVVDIGWGGTMQYYLSNLLTDQKIEGYYLGISWGGDNRSYLDHKKGLLFDYREGNSIFLNDYFLYELICVADHGATVGYAASGEPILVEDSDCEIYEREFRDIQNNIVGKFMRINAVFGDSKDMRFLKKYVSLKYGHMLLTLNKREKHILSFANTKHEDNFVTRDRVVNLKYWFSFIKKKSRIFVEYLKAGFALYME